MARQGIKYDEVANAAAAIRARGTEPTISAIRLELGNSGSYSTISQHLNRWRDEATDKVQTAALPPEVETAAMEAITKIWNVAHQGATREIASIRQEAADEKSALLKELSEAREEIERLEELNRKLDVEIHDRAARTDKAEKKLAELTGELHAHKQLISMLQPQHAAAGTTPQDDPARDADTKPERRAKRANAPENKPA